MRLMPIGLLTSWGRPPPGGRAPRVFRLDQRILCFPQIAQRGFRGILGLAHLQLAALALADVECDGNDAFDLAFSV